MPTCSISSILPAIGSSARDIIAILENLRAAHALNAEIETIAVPYAAKVIRELFMNSAYAGSMGINTVPLSELYAGLTASSGTPVA